MGPQFGYSCLTVELQGTGGCISSVNDDWTFGSLVDLDGNSVLTGCKDRFSASEVEVFRV